KLRHHSRLWPGDSNRELSRNWHRTLISVSALSPIYENHHAVYLWGSEPSLKHRLLARSSRPGSPMSCLLAGEGRRSTSAAKTEIETQTGPRCVAECMIDPFMSPPA